MRSCRLRAAPGLSEGTGVEVGVGEREAKTNYVTKEWWNQRADCITKL